MLVRRNRQNKLVVRPTAGSRHHRKTGDGHQVMAGSTLSLRIGGPSCWGELGPGRQEERGPPRNESRADPRSPCGSQRWRRSVRKWGHMGPFRRGPFRSRGHLNRIKGFVRREDR